MFGIVNDGFSEDAGCDGAVFLHDGYWGRCTAPGRRREAVRDHLERVESESIGSELKRQRC